uniref:Uncharacterized protein n=1 Tax=Glycine max TaxID=3847 RepID=C6T861_SOYBN|nr:unknown [Glycine max]
MSYRNIRSALLGVSKLNYFFERELGTLMCRAHALHYSTGLAHPFCKSFNECVIQHFNSNSSCYTGGITSETQLKVIFTKYLTSTLIYTIPHLESRLEYSMFQEGALIPFHLL